MRKTGLLAGFIALTLIVGCESDGCKFTYSKYYIENYVDGDLVLLPYYAVRSSASDLPAPVSEGFRAQSRYGIQQSEVASMVGFDRIRRQFHRHKSYQRQRLERRIPGGNIAERQNGGSVCKLCRIHRERLSARVRSWERYSIRQTVVGLATRRSAGGRIHSFLLVDLLVYTLFYVGSRQSGRGAHFYGGIHHFGRYGQDCLDNLHAGGRSCVAINSRQEQHNIRSNFNTG